MILRCTKRLLAVIGPTLVAEPAPAPDAEDWYANLLWLDRRKCLLLTHAATLFSIFEADVRAADLRATSRLVTRLIEREIRSEGLPSATFADLEPDKVILAKTADRSVLGCMNDMTFLCETAISGSGGLARTDLGALNRSLRRKAIVSRPELRAAVAAVTDMVPPPGADARPAGGRTATVPGFLKDTHHGDRVRRERRRGGGAGGDDGAAAAAGRP